MAKQKGQHKSDKEQYGAYSTQFKRIKNRKAKLARHLKKFPNDEQALAASKTEGTQRSKSHTKGNYPAPNDTIIVDKAGTKATVGSFDPYVKK